MKCKHYDTGTEYGNHCDCNGDLPDSWKSVLDELPEVDHIARDDSIDVIIYSPVIGVSHEVYSYNYKDERWEFSDKTVTHWQSFPLPPPPAGKGE